MTTVDNNQNEPSGGAVWDRVMGAALAIPGVKVDRAGFLRSQLAPYCDACQIRLAIEGRPADAGVPLDVIDKLANGSIRLHVAAASSLSFAAGLPGGWAMAATIPADTVQFYWHAIVLSQKLAYLYGLPDILNNGEVDDETKLQITLLIGAMLGAAQANKVIGELARRIAEQVGRRLPRMALTRTAWYPIIKQIARWIGVRITTTTFARGASKIVPVVGGAVSASVTAATMMPMANRLKNHLRELPLANPDKNPPNCGGGERVSGAIPMPPAST